MGRIWPTGWVCQPLPGDVSAPWLAVEVTGSAEAIEPGPGCVPSRAYNLHRATTDCISTHRDPCLGIRQYHLYPFLCSLDISCLPTACQALPWPVGDMEQSPSSALRDPCSHYQLCEQGFWDIDPRAMSGSTWMRRWRTTARVGPQVTPDFCPSFVTLDHTKLQTSASPLKKINIKVQWSQKDSAKKNLAL